MRKNINKILIGTFMVSVISGSLVGCASNSEKETDNTVTTTAQVSTMESTTEETTTKEVETTTKEPEVEYLYKGFITIGEEADYFEGLILEKGDIIYINDICPNEVDDETRGSLANVLTYALKMNEENELINSKYREEGWWGPEIPYSANYCFEYTGEKIQFIFVEEKEERVYFDIVFVK